MEHPPQQYAQKKKCFQFFFSLEFSSFLNQITNIDDICLFLLIAY